MPYKSKIHRCEHLKVNGTQCGSPAIRHQQFCFFHGRWRAQHIMFATSGMEVPAIDLPVLEDADSIQIAIMQVLSLLLGGRIDHKTSALVLYGLQTASGNLRRTRFEPYRRDVVIDPAAVSQTGMGENAWQDSDPNIQEDQTQAQLDGAPAEALPPAGDPNPRNKIRAQITTLIKEANLEQHLTRQ